MLTRFIKITLLMASLFILIGCGATGTPKTAPSATNSASAVEAGAAATDMPVSTQPATTEATVRPHLTEAGLEATARLTPTSEMASQSAGKIRTFHLVPEASEARYEVDEEFFGKPIPFVTTIGRTNTVEGEFQVDFSGGKPRLGLNQFSVDLRTLASDDNRRDKRIRDKWLESNKYPFARFTATTIENFPNDAAEGQVVPFKIVGDMNIREVTRTLTFDTQARLQSGGTITGTATTFLYMKDFGFDPPDILGILKVTDGVTVTVDFSATEAGGSTP